MEMFKFLKPKRVVEGTYQVQIGLVRRRRGKQGVQYFVTGDVMLKATSSPGYAACQALASQGICGSLEVYDAKTKALRFTIPDIVKGAAELEGKTR